MCQHTPGLLGMCVTYAVECRPLLLAADQWAGSGSPTFWRLLGQSGCLLAPDKTSTAHTWTFVGAGCSQLATIFELCSNPGCRGGENITEQRASCCCCAHSPVLLCSSSLCACCYTTTPITSAQQHPERTECFTGMKHKPRIFFSLLALCYLEVRAS